MFECFRAMRTTKSHLRYFDYLGNVLDAWGKSGGQQGDALERTIRSCSAYLLIICGAALSPSTAKTHAWISGAQRGVLSPPRCLLSPQPVHQWDGMRSSCGAAWRPTTARRHVPVPRRAVGGGGGAQVSL
jgi:hypothetical protein